MLGISTCSFLVSLLAVAACTPTAVEKYRLAFPDSRPVAVVEGDPFSAVTTLDRRALIDAVLARNPDVEAARASWRRALTRVPQESALDDPMLSYSVAPLSIVGDAPFGQRVEIEQKLPLTSRRELAGQVALAEAEAMREDIKAVQLRLATMASSLFDDYYVATRSLEVDEHHRTLLEQMRAAAEAQYVAGRASQQDPLQADVELAMLERERLMHETERRVAIASINGLLHRDLDAPLPPAPEQLISTAETHDPMALTERALRDRPEVRSQDAKLRQGSVARQLADRTGTPDLGIMASYDSMWDMPEHRWMIGLSIDVPLARERRAAARAEAEAQTDEARFARLRVMDDIRVEVRVAIEKVTEARAALALYEKRMLPASRLQAEAARNGFIANQNEFQAVITAQRALRHASLEVERARADVQRRLAELDRALGVTTGGVR